MEIRFWCKRESLKVNDVDEIRSRVLGIVPGVHLTKLVSIRGVWKVVDLIDILPNYGCSIDVSF